MSLALYRKYRSRSLDDIVGQNHVTSLLRTAIKQDKVAHAYLFTGPRGVGKTSIARIIAHAINDLPYKDDSSHLDIIEIDAASNNGVDDIRDLRERVQIAPVNAKKKIYIIDEVHMLSKPAFNALLKTLEEPPAHVVFILATTDLDKVPATILSRTQRHTFRKANENDIISNLSSIADSEKLSVDNEALRLIARHSHGSFRDSVSLFDQLTSGLDENDTLTIEFVQSSLGLASDDTIEELMAQTLSGDIASIRASLSTLESNGIPARIIANQIIQVAEASIEQDSEYARLINELLDIGTSSHPDLKLLTTLSLFAATPVKLSTSVQPVQSVPASNTKTSASSSSVSKAPITSKKEVPSDTQIEKSVEIPSIVGPIESEPFDWDKLIAYVRTHHVALHSVLSKCQPVLQGTKLTLYTKSAFYKKKLDDSRYRVMLNGALEAIGMNGIEIDTLPTGLPIKDSDAAKVAAIMGGGEEVSPNE